MPNNYAKLRDGSWGVRVDGTVRPGQKVTVSTKKGKTHTEIVDKVIWTGNGVTLASVKREEKEDSGPKADLQTQCLCAQPCCSNGQCHCQASCPCITGVICEEVPF